mmetsp:Transcript_9918/g.17020  ORF Transcript_9918/g.17020 Transcript_9918/m.17020 type:complete len:319 (+) Transcript_9918:1204-2160(+)
MPVARVQVADRVISCIKVIGHASRAEYPYCFGIPDGRTASVVGSPHAGSIGAVLGSLGEIFRDSRGGAGTKRAVRNLDGLASRHLEVRVEGLDGGVVPGGDHAAQDLRQEARVKLNAGSGQLVTGHRVEHSDGANQERDVQHLAGSAGIGIDLIVPSLGHRDVSGAKVVKWLIGVCSSAGELLLSGAGTNRAVGHEQRHLGLLLHDIHHLPEELGRVGRAGPMQLVILYTGRFRHCGLQRSYVLVHLSSLVFSIRLTLRAQSKLVCSIHGKRGAPFKGPRRCGGGQLQGCECFSVLSEHISRQWGEQEFWHHSLSFWR